MGGAECLQRGEGGQARAASQRWKRKGVSAKESDHGREVREPSKA